MKTNQLLLLSLAMSATLFATACNRDPAPPPAEAPVAVEPAPAPMTPAPGTEMSFADMDKNADGGISMDELTAGDMLHQTFTATDTDGDGKLSPAEVDKHRADMAAMPAN